MAYEWLGRLATPVLIGILFGVLRKYFPVRVPPDAGELVRPESGRLPTGVYTSILVGAGLLIGVGGFFALRGLNQLFGWMDQPALLQVFPTQVWWAFLPGFAALSVPWPVTIAWMRRSRFREDAAFIERKGNTKAGFDGMPVMVGMNVFIILPMAIFTLLAVPVRMSFMEAEIRWTHYASVRPEVFRYSDARRATVVDGYKLRDGSFRPQRDLVLDFADGRRLSVNAVGDGGSEPSAEEVRLVLSKTGLVAREVRTVEELR